MYPTAYVLTDQEYF